MECGSSAVGLGRLTNPHFKAYKPVDDQLRVFVCVFESGITVA